ncbi:hypothetical protein BBO99_00000431 [Phytophthora kernoviae]|uniref:START domain-containing protein n=2 Tax=Phytophthora kernoviae TaxID=325452 RepID=A0A421F390_9STRA|nr:hypothetical protein G195_003366 [Phytophthora kernoviae 00238/432]KAG2525860.1 hypothetical protein JM16_004186 [Phytophthora kernoviae]KAG2527626.1 hypothetical protein JM18_003710 [Phytophthora kernoviae]RLN20623.1 hypothetical protein BBI17_004506 [Phytophthora kernoviae]RLN85526.1 hypothetical protein BBO99_00000431 [Phytophthora kernoviae]
MSAALANLKSSSHSDTASMTKFPLEQPPFHPIHLCANDKETLVELADVFVSETLEDYESHLHTNNGVVDLQQWVPVNQFESVTVYQDRETLVERRLSRANIMRDRNAKRIDMLKLLWFGTVLGNLDDLMYAVVNPTTNEAKVKAAYVGSNVLDFEVLDTIVQPTPDDPYRSLQIKWAVNGGPPATRSVVRCRDFVYLESTGMTMSSTGERIGFHILHSIAIPGAPELHEHKVIRGNMTLYHLYRQKSDGVMETFVKALIDVKGGMPLGMAMKMSVKGVVSVWNLGEYALMKKLNWMLAQRRPIIPSCRTDFCTFCHKNMRGAMVRRKTCKICVYRTATYANGLDIALGELTKKSDQYKTYAYWAAASPTSSSSSIMP